MLLDRALYRRIDPVSHHIYHVPPASGALSPAVTPLLPDGSPDTAALARLVPRGDDTIPNVERRLAAWHKHHRYAAVPLQQKTFLYNCLLVQIAS